MVGQVVAARHPGEHGAHPLGGLALRGRAGRRGSLHANAASMAESTRFSSSPDTTVTSPTFRGSTKCTLPWTVFLSVTRRPTRLSAGMPLRLGMGPYRRMVWRIL